MTAATSAPARILAIAVAIAVAHAQTAYSQTADAEALFREGKRLLKRGEIAAACEKFEASERIEAGIGTELNLADCRQKNGQTASAWAMFVKAEASAKRGGDNEREAEALRRAKLLEDQLIYLKIVVPDETAVDGLVIKRNSTRLETAQWNTKLPIDPGDYTIHAEAPGFKPWEKTVSIKTTNRSVEVPALERAPHEDVVNRGTDNDDQSGGEGHRRVKGGDGLPPKRRFTVAAVTMSVIAVGALGGSTGLLLYGRSVEDQADHLCPSTQCMDSRAVSLNHTARLDTILADVGFGVGGVAAVAAVALWWTGTPPHERMTVAPVAGRDHVGLSVIGRF
jgi:hypothetical protein